jgi:hypothetical protein
MRGCTADSYLALYNKPLEGSLLARLLLILILGGGVLQVDTFTAERYPPHQIKRHNPKVQAPAP